jgi:hypothetical protein
MKTLRRKVPFSVAAFVIALSMAGAVWAAWDSTKPSASSALLSADVRSNFQAIEQSALAVNLVEDATFQLWPNGTSSAPWGWTLSGTGAAVAQDTSNLNGLGPYSAKVTFGSAPAVLGRPVLASTSFLNYFRSRTFSAAMAIKTSSAAQARVEINDGIASSYSSYHTGDGTFQWLQVTRTIDPAATIINVNLRVESAGSAYVQGVNAAFGPIPGAVQIPRRNLFDGQQLIRSPLALLPDRLTAGSLPILLDSQVGSVANVGSGETTLYTYTLPAGTLSVNGQGLEVEGFVFNPGNANSKVVKLYFGATSQILVNNANSAAGMSRFRVRIRRTSATSQTMYGIGELAPAWGSTAYLRSTPAETLANAIVVKITATCVSNGDITGEEMTTWFLRGGVAQAATW